MPIPKKRDRKHRLRIESLEDRRVPATWGIPWADPQHLTASFVPDGTVLPSGTSQLYQTLNSELGIGNWQIPILKALQTWAVNSNINIGLVADGGEPLGVAGLAQSDARFGDIRISAEPLSSDVVAITTPYSPGGGTLSGDIILNSNNDFNPADSGSYDLYTVILHEAGHVFGFADSTAPANFMDNVYQGPQTGLASGAIPALQALYGGSRNIDAIDNNPVSTSATSPISIPSLSSTTKSVTLPGDIATAQASNYFEFQAPASTISASSLAMSLGVETSGISLLTPKVSIYPVGATGLLGSILTSVVDSNPLTGGLSVKLGGLTPGGKYEVQVQGATGDVFSVGSYDLTLTSNLPSTASPTAGSVALSEPSTYSGSTPLSVTDAISINNQVDVYSFKTPASTVNGMTISLQDWGLGLSAPSFTVYNSANVAVGSAMASGAANPSVSLQLAAVMPNSTYDIRLTDGTINGLDFGTYQATVSFGAPSSQAAGFTLADPWFGPGAGASSTLNTSLQTAVTLQAPAGQAPDSVYDALDGVDPVSPTHYYKLTAPTAACGQAEVMTVSVQTLGNAGLLPWLTVHGPNGTVLNAQSITEQNGIAVVQVTLPTAGAQYTIGVAASPVPGASSQGNFVLDATFGTTMATIGPIASGTLAAGAAGSAASVVSTTVTIGQGELDWFDLAGSASNPASDAVLTMTVIDASGNTDATLSTPANYAASLVTFLAPETYTIEISAYSPSGSAIPALNYVLTGSNDTDPLKGSPTSGSGGATR